MNKIRTLAVVVAFTVPVDKIVSKIFRSYCFEKLIIVDNSNAKNNLYHFNNVIHIYGNNNLREFGAYSEGLDYALKNNFDFDNIVFINDTVYINRELWKINPVIKAFDNHRFAVPVLYGFLDRTMNIISGAQLLWPNFHIRSDIFSINTSSIKLLQEIFAVDFHASFRDACNSNPVLNSAIADFMTFYHPYKLGQSKETATYIELLITSKFFNNGCIFPVMDTKFQKILRLFRTIFSRFIHALIRKINYR